MKDSAVSTSLNRIGVLGAGAWGTALAQVACAAGRHTTIWAFEPEVASAIQTDHENALFLPGHKLNPALTATTDLAALADQDAILAVAPAQHMRATLVRLNPLLRPGQPIVLCAKGIEQGSLALMTEVAAQAAPKAALAVLSGPGFARDVVRGLPTATTIACADEALGKALVASLGTAMFRPYWTDDLIGAEIGGAVKNVIAIACGVAEGRKLGDGARAALITRGFAEMSRLGRAMGARQETLNGLSGLGDLVLTCSSLTSRNMSLGAALASGADAVSVLAERRSVAEGAASAPAMVALAARHNVDMPICAAIDALIAGRAGSSALMSRDRRRQRGGTA
jgi:glycerol-3-phosphate dehydrogenase (NAD(P)+)